MAKGHKYLKRLKSEKMKTKLKAKKTKHLPKDLNITDPSFKVRTIVIREQLKQHDKVEILSKRKLNIKDLLSRLQHYNSTVRQDAVKELKEILSEHSFKLLSSQFGPLLQGVCALSLDKEKDIRRNSLKVLSLILGPISNDQLNPYSDVLISYLRCSMTHIDPYIKEDSLLFLDVLVQNCSNILAKNSYKVLPNFLDMISKLHTEIKPGRLLVTTLNSKNTNIKWRIQVLERLATMFSSMVTYFKSQESISYSDESAKFITVNKNIRYIPTYTNINFQNCEIDFEKINDVEKNNIDNTSDADEFVKYIELLMPLIFDSWVEVCPDKKNADNFVVFISTETLELLKSIITIIQLIIECIDILHTKSDVNIKFWFKSNFQSSYIKKLLSRFPYYKLGKLGSFLCLTRERQQNFTVENSCDYCLECNLGICQIYVWFTSLENDDKMMSKLNKNYCTSIIKYLNEKLKNWSNIDNIMLSQLTKLLRTLFLKASKIWYKNHLDLSETLQLVINACCNQSKREIQLELFSVISEIMLDHTLQELHRENVFKKFISTLPSLLLKSKIHENTIQIINKIVLRYRNWIQKELLINYKNIIENAKKIEIIGSEDHKQSRLMICNLFYFLDTEIFY
ncbi:hypothetical protein E2986_05235 [Frieseomelitta varia]|uniref:Pre-rRNA-processing protein Ipi1 N-terminal domain-containing protein n=1 Tax=Frieseomelitta varia TaxID=561572 RepID=A0A833RPH0_9HYME|nr:testis-expressed protein 10 [Frieseomelitta varia]KAF3421246.1 hypothetical protein E2986_05235 [Frieseomelitta varia]